MKLDEQRFLEGHKKRFFETIDKRWRGDTMSFPFLDKNKRITEKNSDIDGKTIILVGEGGLGDQIAHMRFCELLKQKGANVLILFEKEIEELIIEAYPFVTVYTDQEFDHYILTYDVPYLFNLTSASKNITIPYLKVTEKYDLSKGVNVGIRWESKEKDHRAIPLQLFAPFLQIGNLYSLQRDTGLEDIRSEYDINTDYSLETIKDTLKLINSLDIIISSCCFIGPLAAACGAKTIIISHQVPFPYWAERWFPNAKLFCQKISGNWEHPIIEAYEYLRNEYET